MSASADRVSAIIPAFNRRNEILRAIASCLNQTRAPDEILVIDDASTDGTADAVLAVQDSRIKLLRHTQNRGAAAARNTGIEAAVGDWIAFLDSDDEWAPQKLSRQLDLHDNAPADMAASVTGYVIRDYRTGEERRLEPTPFAATLDAVVLGCALGLGSTMVAHRQVFAEVGPLDPDLPRLEDWEWLMRYLPAHRLGVLPEPLAIVHKGGDPSVERVAAALARIKEKHRAAWYRRSWSAGRKFDSTLLVEEAAASYYARDRRKAVLLSLRALALYPFRGASFGAMLARRALRTNGRRKESGGLKPL